MKQEHFEQRRRERWRAFESQLEGLGRGTDDGAAFPVAYRSLCTDLALARARGFTASLVDELNDLVVRGHEQLYGRRRSRPALVRFLAETFPRAVRARPAAVAAASLLFYGAGIASFALGLRDPELIYSVIAPSEVAGFEHMYDPAADHYGTPRGTVDDLQAFSFYVSNNIGVALRTFAWGLFAGVGSLVVLVLNGLIVGLLGAHLTLAAQAETFFSFVVTHAAFELTAIVLAGVCGLELGAAVLAPGRLSRSAALRRSAQRTVLLIYGVIALLLLAAMVEAFWSANVAVPPEVKFGIGAAAWVFVASWLGLGGRARAR